MHKTTDKGVAMTIFIDADGCPVVRETVSLAKKHDLPVTIVKNYAHVIENDYAQIITVDISSDSADYYIANHLQGNDILITQDYGLAAMALSKRARCLNQNGLIITNDNIMTLLDTRHVNQKLRRDKNIYSKIRKRTPEDNDHFLFSLRQMILDVPK